MADHSDLTTKEDLRSYALQYIQKTFGEKLSAFTSENEDQEVSEDVKAKFEQVGSLTQSGRESRNVKKNLSMVFKGAMRMPSMRAAI